MNIVIIGYNGFIGSHLLAYFTSIGANILCVGRIRQNCFNHQYISLDKYLELDSKIIFDIWINAAGSGNVQLSITNPEIDYLANVELVHSLLKLKKKIAPTGAFIHFSSAAVYGNPQTLPISENEKLSPISPYGVNKLLSEEHFKKYSYEFGLKTVIFRPFSIYGIDQKKLILWDIFEKVKLGQNPIILFGNGLESRDFLHIGDLTKLVELAIKESLNNNVLYEVYNAASGQETTIVSVTKIIESIFPEIEIKFSGDIRIGDPRNWKADISKAKKIGFEPTRNLKDGIEEYYKWLKDER